MFYEIRISTIKLSEGRFQAFHDTSLSEERKICDMEVEIVTFVVKGSAQLTVTLARQK